MGQRRYTEDFKAEVLDEVTVAGYVVYDVANRLGVETSRKEQRATAVI